MTRQIPFWCEWRIVGASAPGTSHARGGIQCQDAYSIWHGPNGIAVIAVADGAGTAANSNLGSTEAAELAVGALRAHFLQKPDSRPNIYEALKKAWQTVRNELEIYACIQRLPLESLATTLAVAVLMPDCLAVAQTGDGLIVSVNFQDELRAETQPQSGEYANETFFITGRDANTPRFVEVYNPVVALAVLTDGLLPIVADYRKHQPHQGFFGPMFRALNQSEDQSTLELQLADFLDSNRVNAHTDDDKTLVLAVRTDIRSDERLLE